MATTLTALGLATQASAFVIITYSNEGCTGSTQEVNVYDNTCAGWMNGFKSYKPTYYGGSHQYATFWDNVNCAPGPLWEHGWADGGDGRFRIGDCDGFGGAVVRGVSSYYRVGSGRQAQNETETE